MMDSGMFIMGIIFTLVLALILMPSFRTDYNIVVLCKKDGYIAIGQTIVECKIRDK